MYNKLFFILSLAALCTLSSCKKGVRRAFKAANTVSQVSQLRPNERDVSAPVLRRSLPSFGKPVQLPDSSNFKCFSVDVILPEDTMNYYNAICALLPYETKLDYYSRLRISVNCFLRSDTSHLYSSHILFYQKDPLSSR